MRNRGIGRARMFMGGLLLLAAALTWGIILTVSPHGQPVASGTEYVRSTILTFKRNGAIGTLILCGLAAWLLFPRRRPKWPVRDWSLYAMLALLAGSSVYTLISLQRFGAPHTTVDGSGDPTDPNVESNAPQAGSEMNALDVDAAPPPLSNDFATAPATTAVSLEPKVRPTRQQPEERGETEIGREPADSSSATAPADNQMEMTNSDIEQNQE